MTKELLELQSLNVLSLRMQILDQMRDAILGGVFHLGQKLVETVIADRLGVSRAPVREALSILESEGLLVNVPRRGTFVVDFTDKDIDEIYSLRLILERGALRRAMDRLTDDDLARMQALVDDLGKLMQAGASRQEVVRRDMAFHETICRVADHRRLFSVWNSTKWQTQLLIGLTSETHSGHPQGPKEYHQVILDAIRRHDVDSAEVAIVEHIHDAHARATAAMHALRQAQA